MGSSDQSKDATVLLRAAAGGDREAADRLLPVVYQQLRAAAQVQLGGHAHQTLQATALVHEAYLKLIGPRRVPWQDRRHFYSAAAEAMRQILLDRARKVGRRGGPMASLSDIGDVSELFVADAERILAVDEAMRRLEAEDQEAAAIVRLRFFAGLSVEDAARALELSPRTAARLWSYARARLFDLIRAQESAEASASSFPPGDSLTT
ncbi:MAG TPA: ECF-type sigma factor [Phycisphaerales bacterium]|nr:ECF-type sigma factor [Phycisphaerales bacterium]